MTFALPSTLPEFASALEKLQLARRHEAKNRIWKPTATSATLLGYDCLRRIEYARLIPWVAEPVSAELASIFAEGDMHEKQAMRELEEELGVRLMNRQASFEDRRYEIKGIMDAEIVHGDKHWPVEFKGLSFVPGDTLEDGDDLATSERQLWRRYLAQLQIYLYLRSLPEGLFIFKSKATGRWRCVPVQLDYEIAEKLLQKAEKVRDVCKSWVQEFSAHKAYNQDGPQAEAERELWAVVLDHCEPILSERIPDRSECSMCPYRKHCNPSQAPVEAAQIVTDTALIAKLEARAEAEPWKKKFEKAHEEIRSRFMLTGGSTWYAGAFKIEKIAQANRTIIKIRRQEKT